MAGTIQRFNLYLFAALFVALMAVGGCNGGGNWVPQPGPYSGTFDVGDQIVGNLTLTATATAVTGTGSLTHNDQPVSVAIAASVTGQTFTGYVSNASLGSGPFTGSFQGNVLQGTFSYTDTGGVSTTTGTWTVTIEN